MNREMKQYYRNIQRLLPGSAKQKKQLMETLWQSIDAYIEEHPETTIQEVQEHFGTPQQIASAYLDEMPAPEIIKKIKTRKTVIGIVCAAAALALIMWAIGLAITVSEENTSTNGYIETGSIIVEEMEEYE